MAKIEFQPIYYADRINKINPKSPNFELKKLNIVNFTGHAGIVTLWSDPKKIWTKLIEKYSRLLDEDSPLVTLTSLYGNGLPQMLANLANNPQIKYLAITGNDTPVVPSSTYIQNFLTEGIEAQDKDNTELNKIIGTSFSLDSQLDPNIFKHIKFERFKSSDLEGLVNFITQPAIYSVKESDRIKIELIEPEFSDFPSDITSHSIYAKTPLEAWMEVYYRLNRFGKNIQLKKGIRRTLFNLDVHIADPSPEDDVLLRSFNFDPNELHEYRKQITDPTLPPDTPYTYGNRLMAYFGGNTLEKIVERFKEDPNDRHSFVSIWDTKEDLLSESKSSKPCFTDAYFTNHEGELLLTVGFRTHAASAWMLNLYGLRAIQEYVAERVDLNPGKINVKSRWIGINPEDAKTVSALGLVEKNREIKLNVHDPMGYFIVGVRDNEIFAEHYSPDAAKLKTYTGKTAKEIKDQLRQNTAILNSDHSMWVGYELAKAHHELHGELPEL